MYVVSGTPRTPFSAFATNLIPDVGFYMDAGQFFARHFYAESDSTTLFEDSGVQDNITDWALSEYRKAYGSQVSKDDIFYYVYALLHSPEYRERYAADLRKSLPRIPQVSGRERFEAFVQAGRDLSELHINYEDSHQLQLVHRHRGNSRRGPGLHARLPVGSGLDHRAISGQDGQGVRDCE